MVTQTFTLPEFEKYIANLPKKFEKHAENINLEMAQSLQRRIRARAPYGSTGSLKRDIKIEVDGKNLILTGPGHWSYVNAGVFPGKPIPVEFFEMHQTNPGSTAGSKGSIWINDPKSWVIPVFDGGKGFVDNAFKAADAASAEIINKGMIRTIRK